VAQGIHEKLVRRHPHVFGEVKAKTAGQVLKNWEQLKAAERVQKKREAQSLLDGVPHTLPALLEAYQMTRRAARIGFDWDDLAGILEKVKEEAREVTEAAALKSPLIEEEAGDLLFAAVNMARFLGIDPEIALKKANRKFASRFREMERHMDRQGRKLAEATRQEMEDLWDRSKASA
jgi:MazG family protein